MPKKFLEYKLFYELMHERYIRQKMATEKIEELVSKITGNFNVCKI